MPDTSKNSQIRSLLRDKIPRAEIARQVQCSYQYVRNEEQRFYKGIEQFLVDPNLEQGDYILHLPTKLFGLYEETPLVDRRFE